MCIVHVSFPFNFVLSLSLPLPLLSLTLSLSHMHPRTHTQTHTHTCRARFRYLVYLFLFLFFLGHMLQARGLQVLFINFILLIYLFRAGFRSRTRGQVHPLQFRWLYPGYAGGEKEDTHTFICWR